MSHFTEDIDLKLEHGNIAIIGGTGFEQLPPDMFAELLSVTTVSGEVPVLSVSNNYVEPYKLYFLSRHGATHGLAPHQIDYRANILALQELEVKHVLATNAVGALRTCMQPGDLVLMDDFIDFTRTRPFTLFEGTEPWKHTDFTKPYSEPLRRAVHAAAHEMGVELHTRGTYLGVEGPRFESPAEIRMFASWGADVVGMTGLPEVVFAREAGLNYAAIGIVTNLAAGLSSTPINHEDVVRLMSSRLPVIRELLLQTCFVIRRRQDSGTQ